MEEINALDWYTNPDGFSVSSFVLLGEGLFVSINPSNVSNVNISNKNISFSIALYEGFSKLLESISHFNCANIKLSDWKREISITAVLDTTKMPVEFNFDTTGIHIQIAVLGNSQAVTFREKNVFSNQEN